MHKVLIYLVVGTPIWILFDPIVTGTALPDVPIFKCTKLNKVPNGVKNLRFTGG